VSLGCLGTRSDPWSLCYFDGVGYVVRTKPVTNTHTIASMYTLEKRFSYGRYRATVRAYCTRGSERVFPLGFENHHGFPEEGIITFLLRHGSHYAMSSFNGKTYESEMPGQDWTKETVLEIDWREGEVTFIVDGVEVATHRTDMGEGSWFIESIGLNNPVEIYAMQRGFERLESPNFKLHKAEA